ncbi:MAG: FAD-binding oxidoreductase [Desulfobacula sp.]|jgi:D-lactate dehydrogenase (cytochrome)|uniref:FAD-binding oxidoreductase n=1 Tax=Desulfobacula sp. TaxID=2593537 RepID=UPI001DA5C7D4|nr:FAD-binding oxidoreductase [Desulfobacula sp.]MBT3483713.1 FAD-binding oxidoreductase [Desulfobacula sp.]MBT3803512.1 FAD-binding oxidoreductase [Desulfobacula sp.]MBT4023307.1 FAD-binding oxidoreductase [Desulfobacula sp.]MBT4197292.1 FAD-binding oxidoreductase [Desulfobacula sp.]
MTKAKDMIKAKDPIKVKSGRNLILPLQDLHKDYLKDESRISGKAETISFPENETQVQDIVKILLKQKTPITVQGSRTGITGGAVPMGGHILNLSKMIKVTGLERDSDGQFSIRVQPGICLSELNEQIFSGRFNGEAFDKKKLKALEAFKKADRLFWPPDPSERSASIGGIAANNSRGICSLHYGPARLHIKGMRVVDTRGEIVSISRGQYIFSQGVCPLPGGRVIKLDPALFYGQSFDYFTEPYDLMDLYLGSEGMFGVITQLTLSLLPLPKERWGIVFFFEHQSCALDFILRIKPRQKRQRTGSETDIVAIEFMDHTTLDCIKDYKQVNTRVKQLPDIDKTLSAAVYVQIHGNGPQSVEALSEMLLETAIQCGGDPDNTWAFCSDIEMERPRIFLHAAAESVFWFIDKARLKDSRIITLGMDMGLENASLSKVLGMYQKDLLIHGLKAAIFGHSACEHLQINILPQNYQEFKKGRALIKEWTKKIDTQKASIVTAHGVGKINKDLFASIPLPNALKWIGSVKHQLDPDGLWNPDNMLDSCK